MDIAVHIRQLTNVIAFFLCQNMRTGEARACVGRARHVLEHAERVTLQVYSPAAYRSALSL